MNRYYAVVDEYEDVPLDGKIVQKVAGNPFRDGLEVFRRPPVAINGVVTQPEKCVVLRPDSQGIYMLSELDEELEHKMKRMEINMTRHPSIIGPFNSHSEARLEQEKRRPKTEMELLREDNARLLESAPKKSKKPETE